MAASVFSMHVCSSPHIVHAHAHSHFDQKTRDLRQRGPRAPAIAPKSIVSALSRRS